MSKQQPTVEELLETPEGAQALSKVWRENAEKATDPEEKKQWTQAADDAWKTYVGLSNQAFEKRAKKFAPAARSARAGLVKAKAEAKAAGADEQVLSVIDANVALMDLIAPRKKT
jgi:hypothetical protein